MYKIIIEHKDGTKLTVIETEYYDQACMRIDAIPLKETYSKIILTEE